VPSAVAALAPLASAGVRGRTGDTAAVSSRMEPPAAQENVNESSGGNPAATLGVVGPRGLRRLPSRADVLVVRWRRERVGEVAVAVVVTVPSALVGGGGATP